eukprot:765861-Hanusia_phi.AAC.1
MRRGSTGFELVTGSTRAPGASAKVSPSPPLPPFLTLSSGTSGVSLRTRPGRTRRLQVGKEGEARSGHNFSSPHASGFDGFTVRPPPPPPPPPPPRPSAFPSGSPLLPPARPRPSSPALSCSSPPRASVNVSTRLAQAEISIAARNAGDVSLNLLAMLNSNAEIAAMRARSISPPPRASLVSPHRHPVLPAVAQLLPSPRVPVPYFPDSLPALAFPHQLAVSLPSSSDSRDVELKIPTTKFSNLPHKSRSKKHAIHLIHCPSNLLLFSFSFVSSLHPVLSKPQLTSLFSNHPSITRAASSCPLDLANAMASMPNTLRLPLLGRVHERSLAVRVESVDCDPKEKLNMRVRDTVVEEGGAEEEVGRERRRLEGRGEEWRRGKGEERRGGGRERRGWVSGKIDSEEKRMGLEQDRN